MCTYSTVPRLRVSALYVGSLNLRSTEDECPRRLLRGAKDTYLDGLSAVALISASQQEAEKGALSDPTALPGSIVRKMDSQHAQGGISPLGPVSPME